MHEFGGGPSVTFRVSQKFGELQSPEQEKFSSRVLITLTLSVSSGWFPVDSQIIFLLS
jgi:hypothetical protein